jgi:hypothetical protein
MSVCVFVALIGSYSIGISIYLKIHCNGAVLVVFNHVCCKNYYCTILYFLYVKFNNKHIFMDFLLFFYVKLLKLQGFILRLLFLINIIAELLTDYKASKHR